MVMLMVPCRSIQYPMSLEADITVSSLLSCRQIQMEVRLIASVPGLCILFTFTAQMLQN